MSEQHLGTKMDSSTDTQTETPIPIPELFDNHPSKFEKPTEIGYFSLDIGRKFEIPKEKKESLRSFIRPANPDQVNFDLRKGYDTKEIKAKGKEFNLLTWIQEDTNRRLNADFVCRRGLLAKIMLIPYEKREDWLIAVTLHDGTYYLHEIEKDEAITYDEMCCWGWKFEQYLTSDDTDAPYNNCEAFYTVVRAKLNDHHSLVFSGEVDAINDETGNYMEFKTSRQFAPEDKGLVDIFYRYKIKKWWAQSHIIGVEEIVCGFRDKNGIVHNLEYYDTSKLPILAETVKDPWKSNVCLNALDKVLSIIKESIKTDDHRIAHTLKWSREERESILCSGPFTDSEYNFLPASFTGVVE